MLLSGVGGFIPLKPLRKPPIPAEAGIGERQTPII